MDDGPAGLSKFADEKLSQSEGIGDKPVRPVAPAAIARSSPGIAMLGQVEVKWRPMHDALHALRGALAYIAMGEYDKAAVPARRHADYIIGSLVRSLAQDALVCRAGSLQSDRKSAGEERNNGQPAVANYVKSVGRDNHAHGVFPLDAVSQQGLAARPLEPAPHKRTSGPRRRGNRQD